MIPEGTTYLVLPNGIKSGYLIFVRFSEPAPKFYQERYIMVGYTINPNKWDLEKAKTKLNKRYDLELETLTVR